MKKKLVGGTAFALVASLCAAHAASAQTAPVQAQTSPAEPDSVAEIIVTGVLSQASLGKSAVAVSVLRAEDLERVAPLSAADLLKSVPGVFVNSALGEIRNIVYSRGVSANSVEAAGGYYYVSLQEDGLPVTNVTFTNYGPDYFLRPDVGLGRLEALRGGTATVTGPNAPGGIFNYISRTGGSEFEGEVRAKIGAEGKGGNPYYRGDAYVSGPIGDRLRYSLGGFYRKSTGARDPGYALNRGGQIKGNLTYDYGAGKIQIFGKYLNDHNGWFEFLPARDFNNPKVVSELGGDTSLLPEATSHSFTPYAGAKTRTWDGDKLAHAKAKAIGARIDHDFGDGWSLSNALRLSRNELDWNSGGVIFALPIADPVLAAFLGTTASGLYTYRDRKTGAILAQVNRVGAAATVVTNNLPNQSVMANSVVSEAALFYNPKVDEVMDQISVTRKFERGAFTFGGFYAKSDVSTVIGGAGIGVAPLQDRPRNLDITLTTPGGVVQQVTDPNGYGSIGNRVSATLTRTKQVQASLFAGGNWDVTDKITVDAAVRYEKITNRGSNWTSVALASQTPGGTDGNVNTLYDNVQQGLGPPVSYDRDLNFTSYSAAATYRWSDAQTTYVRVSHGKKAPDLSFYATLTTAAAVANSPSIAQDLLQVEMGHRLTLDRLTLTVNPFYSRLENVGAVQVFNRADGTSYNPPPVFATQETYGVEIDGELKVTNALSVQLQATLQEPKSKDFAVWIANTPGEADDVLTRVPDGEADNSAKIMTSLTGLYRPSDRWNLFATWRYLGERAANRYNTFYLPGFSQVDVGGQWQINDRVQLSGNINNLLDGKGVMSWASAGGLLASLDRQAFTPARLAANPDQTLNILTIQPRSYYLTLAVKF
ncbi:outer membrane receptor protein [Caulobacter sp. AP07]|uniref:TonB-dependent receptor n=1 Tax=Caulobacter sp. AP07 TaxID=1144304 RepID=UPI0002722569|nr:TonB-dependent receptor [Caulobacter sp. AP07]EJL28854.1 outer membrane receptor protein [Caulobacter sp. AP07]